MDTIQRVHYSTNTRVALMDQFITIIIIITRHTMSDQLVLVFSTGLKKKEGKKIKLIKHIVC